MPRTKTPLQKEKEKEKKQGQISLGSKGVAKAPPKLAENLFSSCDIKEMYK